MRIMNEITNTTQHTGYHQCALTTKDNPYNPFEDYNSWNSFDTEKGYYSSSRLMRIAKVTEEMSDFEENIEIERAIDEIIAHDPFDLYKKVTKELRIPTDEELDTLEAEE